MERRNFLRGIFGGYACVSTYFSFKYFQNKTNKNNSNQKLERIEIPIVYHCNLNCASCDHFASIAPHYEVPIEKYKKDINQLQKVTKGNIAEIVLLGGEPLLHKQLCKIFELTRIAFPQSKIEMLTNGTLLEQQSEAFWRSCADNNVGVYISYYRTGKKLFDFDNITKLMDKYQAKVRISYPKFEFQLMNLTKDKTHDIAQRYAPCYSKQWPIFDDGKFYVCSTINGVEKFFNKKFPEHAIPTSQDDVLDIYKITSIEEIIDFYNKPKKMCAYCNYYISGKDSWKSSQCKVSEWYKG